MSSFKQHVENDIKEITKPPFRFPTTTSLRPPATEIAFTTTNANETENFANFANTTDDILQAVETVVNETLISVNETLKFNNEEEPSVLQEFVRNETVANFSSSNANETVTSLTHELIFNNQTEDAIELPDTNSTTLLTSMKPFDWIKPADMEDHSVLKMAHQEPTSEASSNYTLYIILSTMLGVLIAMTLIMLLIYKAYKGRDNYNLQTQAGTRVRVHKTAMDEASSSQEHGHGHGHGDEERDEFEVVDFDNKNSYRF